MIRIKSTACLAAILTALTVGAVGCEPGGEESFDLTVDTFNVGLAGAFIPWEEERRQPIADALATLDSDVVCLQEVWRQSDKELIRDAASGAFPHILMYEHNFQTTIDDPTDQTGAVPEIPTGAPCADPAHQAAVEAAIQCVADNCNTEPGSLDGMATSTECAQEACITQVGALLFGDAAALRCYSCMVLGLPTDPLGDISERCTTTDGATLAFEGQSGVMVLSRHPLSNDQVVVWPGTWNRRILVSATVELPNDATVDVYCNHLTPIFDSPAFPYTGDYGEGQVTSRGWEAEQRLQIERLIEEVETDTGTERAVVLGDMNCGRASGDIMAEGDANLDHLETAFTPAVTPSYSPACTMCPDSPVRGEDTDPVWIDHIFTWNIPADAVTATSRTFVEPLAPVEGDPSMVPLSDHYGLRSTITIEP